MTDKGPVQFSRAYYILVVSKGTKTDLLRCYQKFKTNKLILTQIYCLRFKIMGYK